MLILVGIFTYFPVEDYLVALRVAQFQDLLLPAAGLVVNIYGGDLAEIVVGPLMYNVLPAPRAFTGVSTGLPSSSTCIA